MTINTVLNEFLEGRQIEMDEAKFEKVMVRKKPAMMVYNDSKKYVIKESIQNYNRFKKWDGATGKETIIQPLIGQFVLIEKKPVFLCNLSTDVYKKIEIIDKFESKDNSEEKIT